ncbi:hypothetical protein TNCT_68721 [Trichonephila clavata]|uniref:Uncharacterized protein n=1 Tax=Trichonephila clavata TaxID=2740835 RepID=A0A8X6LZW7_TRICU|nr:hypothetical protein TNCT_68721 [Trichonephila clavata]
MSLRQPITRVPSTPHGLPAYALRLALYDLYASCYWALVIIVYLYYCIIFTADYAALLFFPELCVVNTSH